MKRLAQNQEPRLFLEGGEKGPIQQDKVGEMRIGDDGKNLLAVKASNDSPRQMIPTLKGVLKQIDGSRSGRLEQHSP
jgi:hypothetical protein